MIEPYDYDAAISFAGEDREFARYIADALAGRFRVFFDEFEKAELWGSDLTDTLPQKYIASRYCVILQSNEYLEKAWTTLERQAIIFEFLRRRGSDFVLPIRVGGCTKSIPGLSPVIAYLTVQSRGDWDEVADLLAQKLSRSKG